MLREARAFSRRSRCSTDTGSVEQVDEVQRSRLQHAFSYHPTKMPELVSLYFTAVLYALR